MLWNRSRLRLAGGQKRQVHLVPYLPYLCIYPWVIPRVIRAHGGCLKTAWIRGLPANRAGFENR